MSNSQKFITLTKQLVAINSITLTKNKKGEYNENAIAEFIHDYFEKQHIPSTFIPTPDRRKNVFVFKKGTTKKTIVFIGHIDTVGVEDYETKDPFDTNGPDKNYLYGRGSLDMKSGIAVGMGLMEELWNTNLKTNIIFIAAPDEENASAGIIAAGKHLKKVKDEKGLEYIGVINLDGDFQEEGKQVKNIIAGGFIGKLLPCFYIVGKAAHASDPYKGISSSTIAAEIVKLLDSNVAFSDVSKITGEVAPPPTCLKTTDLKFEYNVQLPLKSFLYFNYLTYQETPKDVMEKIKQAATTALEAAFRENKKKYHAFSKKQGKQATKREWDEKIHVFTYEEIEKLAKKNNSLMEQNLEKLWKENKHLDPRDQNIKLVEAVVKYAKLSAPYVICFYSPPYAPSAYNADNDFIITIKKVVNEFGKKQNIRFAIKAICEGISDMNCLQIDKQTAEDAKLYTKNNPFAQKEMDFDLDVIASISMPTAAIGAYGFHMHEAGEKVEIAYTFTQLPKLLKEIISALQ